MGAIQKFEDMGRPNIFEYHDYREFLSIWFKFLKKEQQGFTVNALCKTAGLSPSYFSMVLKGKFSLSEKVLTKLDSRLNLDREELSFLRHLIPLNDARNLEEQQSAFQKIIRFGLFKAKNPSGITAFRYFSNWYYLAICEMVALDGFQLDEKWISQRLCETVPLVDIREAVRFLLEYGYIKVDQNGKAIINRETRYKCDGPLFKLALTNFYKDTFQLSLDAIYTVPREDRHLASYSAAFSPETFQEIKKVIQKTIDQVHELATQDSGTNKKVYHLSLLSFPLTKPGGEE